MIREAAVLRDPDDQGRAPHPEKTDIESITASSMTANKASANVLRKCGFTLVESAAEEDRGYDTPTLADKWIR